MLLARAIRRSRSSTMSHSVIPTVLPRWTTFPWREERPGPEGAQVVDLQLERGERLAGLEGREERHPHRAVGDVAKDPAVEGAHRVRVALLGASSFIVQRPSPALTTSNPISSATGGGNFASRDHRADHVAGPHLVERLLDVVEPDRLRHHSARSSRPSRACRRVRGSRGAARGRPRARRGSGRGGRTPSAAGSRPRAGLRQADVDERPRVPEHPEPLLDRLGPADDVEHEVEPRRPRPCASRRSASPPRAFARRGRARAPRQHRRCARPGSPRARPRRSRSPPRARPARPSPSRAPSRRRSRPRSRSGRPGRAEGRQRGLRRARARPCAWRGPAPSVRVRARPSGSRTRGPAEAGVRQTAQVAARAPAALAARRAPADHDPVASAHGLDSWPDGLDDARAFVPEQDGRRVGEPGLEHVQVAVADAARLDADEHLVRRAGPRPRSRRARGRRAPRPRFPCPRDELRLTACRRSRARSRSSPAPGAGSAASTRSRSRAPARRSSSTTSAARSTARAPDATPAQTVVDEIGAAGGEAVANYDERRGLRRRRADGQQARRRFGRLDILVNNAGILRDRMLVNMTEERVGRGDRGPPQGPLRADAARSRLLARARRRRARRCAARVINTSSPSGVFGNVGQANYGAAKAGIASFTIIAAQELAQLRRHRELHRAERAHAHDGGDVRRAGQPEEGFDPLDPANKAPIVVALSADEAQGITGQCFFVWGGAVNMLRRGSAGELFASENGWDADDFLAQLLERFPDGAVAAETMVEQMGKAGGRSMRVERAQPRAARRGDARAARRPRVALLRRRVAQVGASCIERARRLAQGLRDAGVEPGDRVVVLMANCPEVGIAYNALWRAGRRGHARDLPAPAAGAPAHRRRLRGTRRDHDARVRRHRTRGGDPARASSRPRSSASCESRRRVADRRARRRRPRGADVHRRHDRPREGRDALAREPLAERQGRRGRRATSRGSSGASRRFRSRTRSGCS